MDSTQQPTPVVLSLCSGILGLDRGIERAIGRTRTAAFVEIEAWAIWNLVAQMEKGVLDPAPVWTNLKTFPAEAFHNRIHGITGGYPCQPFSVSGKREGTNDPRHLWPYISGIIGAVRPLWCFFENVPGHLTLGYEEVRNELHSLGYTVEEGIFSAEEVGAPHQRKRLFILAVDNTTCIGSGRELRKLHIQNAGFRKPEERWENKTEQPQYAGGNELANSEAKRLYRNESEGSVFTQGRPSKYGLFPNGPEEQQHEGEHPRLIKPSMGSTVNGHNHRTDLLRALGNGVVEQTAELAFRTLLAKHGLTIDQFLKAHAR